MEVAQSNAAWLLDSGHCAQGMENVDTKMIGGLSAGGDGDGGITGSARNETLGVVCQKRRVGILQKCGTTQKSREKKDGAAVFVPMKRQP